MGKKKKTLFASLINPTIYLFFVFLRPVLDYQNSYQFKSEAYNYPHDYPFSFFNRCVGKPYWKGDTYQSTWLKQIFWIILVFGVAYLIFSLSAYYLIKWINWFSEYNFYELISHLADTLKTVSSYEHKLKHKCKKVQISNMNKNSDSEAVIISHKQWK